MQALTVIPGVAGSVAIEDMPEPAEAEGPILVESVAVGMCATDSVIASGNWGEPPEGEARMIIGHESLGRVIEAPAATGLARGDFVAGVVRMPGTNPCAACASDEWDMCHDGRHVERGITGSHGFASTRWRGHPDFVVPVPASLGATGVLAEPASVVAKAWQHTEVVMGRARSVRRSRLLVTGAGTIGLLAAMIGRQRGYEVTVFDRVTHGAKPALVHALGAQYCTDAVDEVANSAHVIMECTGSTQIATDALMHAPANAVMCQLGLPFEPLLTEAADLLRKLVRDNMVVFGSVNANRAHWRSGIDALASADPDWLGGLISRRVPLERFGDALDRGVNDVKVVIEL